MMSLDQNFNLLIDVDTGINNKVLKFYVPEPLITEVKAVSRVLGYFYKVISQQSESVPVIVTDWERLVQESVASLSAELRASILKSLDNLFTRMLDSCSVIEVEAGEMVQFFDYSTEQRAKYLQDEYIVDKFKGTTLFILALLRYSERSAVRDTLSDFVTCLTLLELKDSSKKSVKERKQDPVPQSKVSLKTN